MPSKQVMRSDAFPFSLFSDRAPRTAASYERELAASKETESRLMESLAQDKLLLGQKDELIRHQEILSQECNHRFLNSLQMIAGLLMLQSRKVATAEAAASLATAASRVGAIAHLHRHLQSTASTSTVRFKPYLQDLCRDHSTMLASEGGPDRDIVVEGIEIVLPNLTANPLGLIVNELVTNAIKHGEGRITVKLEPHLRKGYALSVCNEGPRLPDGFGPASGKGLGMTLVTKLCEQMGGELRIDRGDANDCTRFTVFFSAGSD